MTTNSPTPDARQRLAIMRWIADLEAMPGVEEVLGWQAIDRDEFPREEEPSPPEGLCVEIWFRRRGEDPRLWHRLQVGPIAPGGGADGEEAEGARPGPPSRGSAMPPDCPGFPPT
jgi:hypothetical protein